MSTWRVIVAGSPGRRRDDLRSALEFEGHWVVETETVEQTLQEAASGRYDVVILDPTVASPAPHQLCRSIRQASNLGMIVLDENPDEIAGIEVLNAGADDYLTAGMALPELLARLRALLRRTRRGQRKRRVLLADRVINLESREILGPVGRVALTPKEFLLLQYLVNHANRPVPHQTLARAISKRAAYAGLEFLRVMVKQLRRKIEPDPSHPRYILTERSIGYMFTCPRESPREAPRSQPLT